MTCRNGHDAERKFISNKMRCVECYREGNARRSQRKRDRLNGVGVPVAARLRCPYCTLIPCECELL